MAQLFIPELDEAVIERLRERARLHGRSLEAEARAIIEEATREEAPEQAFQEEGAPLPPGDEKGFGDLMYERFKDIGLKEEEVRRFNAGIAEANSMWEMGLPDFEADEYEEDRCIRADQVCARPSGTRLGQRSAKACAPDDIDNGL